MPLFDLNPKENPEELYGREMELDDLIRLKGAMESIRGTVNDATVYNVLESLKAAMLVDEREKVYRVHDPMLRTLLLASLIT